MATPDQVTKPTILDEAAEVTAGDRQHFYGHPADNHGNTAELWTSYLMRRFVEGFNGRIGMVKLNARDVCNMMVLLKVSRDANRPKRDNLVDICGYARNAEQIEERSQIQVDVLPPPPLQIAVDRGIMAATKEENGAFEFYGGKFYAEGQAPRPEETVHGH